MNMTTAVLVEDSELAREELRYLLSHFPFVQILAEAADVQSAILLVNHHDPDLVFLDIDLPGGNAFDVLQQIDATPAIIFTTAFDKFALEAYDYNTIDYLLKPIKSDRLSQALNKYLPTPSNEPEVSVAPLVSGSQFFIKDGDKNWIVKVDDVRYLTSVGNHTQIFFLNSRPIYHKALSKIEQRLDSSAFIRINRSQIVNLSYVVKVENWITGGLKIWLSCGTELEVSRRQTLKFKQRLSL